MLGLVLGEWLFFFLFWLACFCPGNKEYIAYIYHSSKLTPTNRYLVLLLLSTCCLPFLAGSCKFSLTVPTVYFPLHWILLGQKSK